MKLMRSAGLLLVALIGVAQAQDGAALYKERCASCHDSPEGRTPSITTIKKMTAEAVYSALINGPMKPQVAGLSTQAVLSLLVYIAPEGGLGAKPAFERNCPADAPGFASVKDAGAWSGWSPDVTNARFQSADAAGLTAANVPRLKLKWAFNLGSVTMARGQPAIAGKRIFLGTLAGDVYAVDGATGCIHWAYKATAGIRSGVVVGVAGGVPAIFFADRSAVMYALNADSGALIWKVRPPNHLLAQSTATPQYYNGMVYLGFSSLEESLVVDPNANCCTFRSSVVAVEASTGRLAWQTFTMPSAMPQRSGKLGPSGAAIWSTPTLDSRNGVIYVSTGDNYSDPVTETSDAVIALDLKTGQILWSRQFTQGDAYNSACSSRTRANCPSEDGPDFDFGQPPILVELGAGRRALVIAQKSGIVHAIDPDDKGAVLWQTRVGAGGLLGGSQWGSAADEQRVYVAISDVGLVSLEDATAPGGRRIGFHPTQGGGLHALDLKTGQIAWSAAAPASCPEAQHTCSPAQSAAVTGIPGVLFSGALDGHVRAYSSADGEVIWDFDTTQEFDTTNGLTARGGSIDATGTAVAGGLVVVLSGYDQFGGMPGNVMLVFSAAD